MRVQERASSAGRVTYQGATALVLDTLEMALMRAVDWRGTTAAVPAGEQRWRETVVNGRDLQFRGPC